MISKTLTKKKTIANIARDNAERLEKSNDRKVQNKENQHNQYVDELTDQLILQIESKVSSPTFTLPYDITNDFYSVIKNNTEYSLNDLKVMDDELHVSINLFDNVTLDEVIESKSFMRWLFANDITIADDYLLTDGIVRFDENTDNQVIDNYASDYDWLSFIATVAITILISFTFYLFIY